MTLPKPPVLESALEAGVALTMEQNLSYRFMEDQVDLLSKAELREALLDAARSLMFYQNIIKHIVKESPEMINLAMFATTKR